MGDRAADLRKGRAYGPGGEDVGLWELGVVGEGEFDKPGMSVGFGGALAVVAIDTETGALDIERLTATDVPPIAIADAVVDALGDRPGLATSLPLTPERIWRAAQAR